MMFCILFWFYGLFLLMFNTDFKFVYVYVLLLLL